jgi:cholesterol transport system auxiliary component
MKMQVVVAVTAAFLAGCFGGLKNEMPPPRIYRIDAPTIEAGASLPADLSIVVERAAPGLDGDGIAGRWPGSRIDYVANARWAGELPRLLQGALIEAFQDSGRLRSVQDDVGRFRTTHTLVIEVRRFEADYTAGPVPVAQVALAVTLGRNSDRQVLVMFTAEASEAATENRQTTLVAALDAAFARAAAEIAQRTFAALAAEQHEMKGTRPSSEAGR